MQFSITFELQGTQAAPSNDEEREKLEEKVYAKVKEAIAVIAIDNNLVLLKKVNTLAVDLI